MFDKQAVWRMRYDLLAVLVVLILIGVTYTYLTSRIVNHSPQAKCMSNMRQLSLSLMMAAQDNKETYPSANEWIVKSGVTGDGIFDCPSSEFKGYRKSPDYMYVGAFFHNQHGLLSKRKLNSIKDTTLTPVLVELANPGKPGQTSYVSDASKMSDDHYGYNPQVALLNKIDRHRHAEGSIIAFADGHVEWLAANKFGMGLLKNAMTEHEPIIK